MKGLLVFLAVVLCAPLVLAESGVPSGDALQSEIRNYNRASALLATSGALGDGAIAELAAKGVKTIIDLRTVTEGTAEEAEKAGAVGVRYINIPVTGAGISDAQLAAFKEVYEALEGPVLVHCASGNRVGAMLARYYAAQGVAPDVALERGRAAGLKPTLEEKIVEQSCDLNARQAC